MTHQPAPVPGSITWRDLTVADADRVKDFYSQVVGWRAEEVPMGGYSDYSMCCAGSSEPVAGICHAKGMNADIPPQWLIYIHVAHLANSVEACTRLGGKILLSPRSLSGGQICIIQDPAGATCALFQAGEG